MNGAEVAFFMLDAALAAIEYRDNEGNEALDAIFKLAVAVEGGASCAG